MFDATFVSVAEAEIGDLLIEAGLTTLAAAAAALTAGKHILLNGGTRKARDAVSLGLTSAAVSVGAARGSMKVRLSPLHRLATQHEVPRNWGDGLLADARSASCWIVIEDIDMWEFSRTALARGLVEHSPVRALASASGLRRRPLDKEWSAVAGRFAWIEVGRQ